MFVYTKQMLEASIRQTREGRVFYPNGRRVGFLIDTATEARIASFFTSFFFVQIALLTVWLPVGSSTHHRGAAMIAFVALLTAIRYVWLRTILRGVPRASVQARRQDAVRRTAAVYSAGRIYLMAALFIVMAPSSLFIFREDSIVEQAAMFILYLAAAIYVCVFAVRVLRAKAAMARGTSTAECP